MLSVCAALMQGIEVAIARSSWFLREPQLPSHSTWSVSNATDAPRRALPNLVSTCIVKNFHCDCCPQLVLKPRIAVNFGGVFSSVCPNLSLSFDLLSFSLAGPPIWLERVWLCLLTFGVHIFKFLGQYVKKLSWTRDDKDVPHSYGGLG